MRLTLTDEAFVAQVSDDGRAFDPLSIPPPARYRPVANRNHLVLSIRMSAGERDA